MKMEKGALVKQKMNRSNVLASRDRLLTTTSIIPASEVPTHNSLFCILSNYRY